jgi:hypothetical protein
VLQERVLSPRVLHFGRSQLFFECAELTAAETYPYGFPDLKYSKGAKYFRDIDFKPTTAGLMRTRHGATSHSKIETYSIWATMVEAYSKTKLTYITDKLIAISGIVKKMESSLDDEYLVGLWRQCLPVQLLWFVPMGDSADGYRSRHPTLYIGPSWSWISIEDQIVFPTDDVIEKTQLLVEDVRLEYRSTEYTGTVMGGHIDLKGWIRSFVSENSNHEFIPVWGSGSPIHLLNLPNNSIWIEASPFLYFDKPQRADEIVGYSGPLYCMLGGVLRNRSRTTVVCLALKVANRTGVKGTAVSTCTEKQETVLYERFGLLQFTFRDGNVEEILEEFKAPVHDMASIPCLSYEDGMHTIRII